MTSSEQTPALDPPAPAGRVIRGTEHVARFGWPADCLLQGGVDGLVLSRDGSYRCAFVEAFPTSPSTFIRGEGATVAEAEECAWKQWQAHQQCPSVTETGRHEFESRGYRNGAGFCRGCNLFASKVFTGTDLGQFCVDCGEPTTYTWVDDDFYCKLHQPFAERDIETRVWLDSHTPEDDPID